LETEILHEDVVMSEPVSEEATVRASEEKPKPKTTEDETKPKTQEGQPKANFVDEEIKGEESLQQQPVTSVDIDMMEQEPESTAADAAVETLAASVGASKPDHVSSVENWQIFASLPNDFKVRRISKQLEFS